MVESSPGGMTWRIAFSIRSVSCSVSSMRVPTRRAKVDDELAGVGLGKQLGADQRIDAAMLSNKQHCDRDRSPATL